MKKILALMLVAMLALTLVACGEKTPAETTAPADDGAGEETAQNLTFKLGGTGPLTGGAAIYGLAVKNAAEIAVEEINAMDGVHFELQYQDDAHDAEKAVNAYNALKDWGMQISMGSVTSTPCVATAAETYADRIFAITPSGSSTAVLEGNDNQFQMCFTDPNQGSASAQYIHDKGLASKVAVIWKNDDVYSKGIYDTFMAAAPGLGLEIVSDTTFQDGNDTNFSVQIADAQSKGAELVFLPMYYTPASLIFAQAKAVGYEPKWFGVDGMYGILTLEGFDTSLAEGVILLTPFNADSEDARTQAFVAKYQEKFGEIPNQFAADAYDCVYAYKQALEDSGCTADMSREEICAKMIEQFTTMTFDGLTGDGMTWDATGAVTKSPKGMVIQNGAYVGLD
ncbi:MAG: ABC transporter substrate-binding protein [Clostridia bacterium]|nr:ABC transporter substrate-binding protein [Clostridia bacterium]